MYSPGNIYSPPTVGHGDGVSDVQENHNWSAVQCSTGLRQQASQEKSHQRPVYCAHGDNVDIIIMLRTDLESNI